MAGLASRNTRFATTRSTGRCPMLAVELACLSMRSVAIRCTVPCRMQTAGAQFLNMKSEATSCIARAPMHRVGPALHNTNYASATSAYAEWLTSHVPSAFLESLVLERAAAFQPLKAPINVQRWVSCRELIGHSAYWSVCPGEAGPHRIHNSSRQDIAADRVTFDTSGTSFRSSLPPTKTK